MDNSNYPTYLKLTAENIPSRHVVIAITDSYIQVSNDLCSALTLGQLVEFDNGAKGLVFEINDSSAKVRRLKSGANPVSNYAQSTSFLNIVQPEVVALDESIGSFYVALLNTKTERPGYVGWTLYNSANEAILMGNDIASHNICQYQGNGKWQPGAYRLEVRSFLKETMQPINYATRDIYLAEEADLISIGNYSDNTPKLVLN